MAEFDTVAKHLIQTYPYDFARFVLQRDDIQGVEVLDTEQPNIRRPDSLLQVRVGGREVLVHHEFQTTDSTDTPMPRRMAGYIGRLIERYGLPVYATSSTCVPTPDDATRATACKSIPTIPS